MLIAEGTYDLYLSSFDFSRRIGESAGQYPIRDARRRILALFPFLSQASRPVAAIREMRARRYDVKVARYVPVATGCMIDPLEDLA
jgi:hypothetical protein